MNICTRCANRLAPGAVICTRCGNRVIQPVVGKQQSRAPKTINKLPIIIAVCALIGIGILAFALSQNSADSYLLKNIPRTINRFIVKDEICEFEAKELTILSESSESGNEVYDTEVIFENSKYHVKRYLTFTCKKSLFSLEMQGDPVDYQECISVPTDEYATQQCKVMLEKLGITNVISTQTDRTEAEVIVNSEINQDSRYANVTGNFKYRMKAHTDLDEKSGLLKIRMNDSYRREDLIENGCKIDWKTDEIPRKLYAYDDSSNRHHFFNIQSIQNGKLNYNYSAHDDYGDYESNASGTVALEKNDSICSYTYIEKMGAYAEVPHTLGGDFVLLIGLDSIELRRELIGRGIKVMILEESDEGDE